MKQTVTIRQWPGMCLLVLALAALIGSAAWTRQARRPEPTEKGDRPLGGLEFFGKVPEFMLMQRDGRRVTLADLRGKVWITRFIYTHSTDTCPLQSARMARPGFSSVS